MQTPPECCWVKWLRLPMYCHRQRQNFSESPLQMSQHRSRCRKYGQISMAGPDLRSFDPAQHWLAYIWHGSSLVGKPHLRWLVRPSPVRQLPRSGFCSSFLALPSPIFPICPLTYLTFSYSFKPVGSASVQRLSVPVCLLHA